MGPPSGWFHPLHERDPRYRHTTTLVPSTRRSRPRRCARRRATSRRSRPSSTRSRPAPACSTRPAGSACSPPASRCAGSAPRPPTPARAWSRAPARPRRGTTPTLRAGVCAWEDLPPGPRFDAVFCVGNSIGHARDRRAALQRARGHAQPGGALVLTSRNWERERALGSRTDGTHTWEIPAALGRAAHRHRHRRSRQRAPHLLAVHLRAARATTSKRPVSRWDVRARYYAASGALHGRRHRVPSDIDARRGQWSVAGMAGAGRDAPPGEPGGPRARLVLRHQRARARRRRAGATRSRPGWPAPERAASCPRAAGDAVRVLLLARRMPGTRHPRAADRHARRRGGGGDPARPRPARARAGHRRRPGRLARRADRPDRRRRAAHAHRRRPARPPPREGPPLHRARQDRLLGAQVPAHLRAPRAAVAAAASRVLRLAALGCFLAAFHLPATLAAVLLVTFAQCSGRLVPFSPASVGAGAAILAASLRPGHGPVRAGGATRRVLRRDEHGADRGRHRARAGPVRDSGLGERRGPSWPASGA